MDPPVARSVPLVEQSQRGLDVAVAKRVVELPSPVVNVGEVDICHRMCDMGAQPGLGDGTGHEFTMVIMFVHEGEPGRQAFHRAKQGKTIGFFLAEVPLGRQRGLVKGVLTVFQNTSEGTASRNVRMAVDQAGQQHVPGQPDAVDTRGIHFRSRFYGQNAAVLENDDSILDHPVLRVHRHDHVRPDGRPAGCGRGLAYRFRGCKGWLGFRHSWAIP